MQNFDGWLNNLHCFYMLIFSGFRHTALRELRFHLESSARAYYLDTKYDGKTCKEKVTLLTIFKPKKTEEDVKLLKALLSEKQYDSIVVKGRRPRFGELLIDVPNREQLKSFYDELCNYVHLSQTAQTDELRYFAWDLALKHPQYETDREMLERTFGHSRYLLLRSLELKYAPKM
jgi:hypothetical protein